MFAAAQHFALFVSLSINSGKFMYLVLKFIDVDYWKQEKLLKLIHSSESHYYIYECFPWLSGHLLILWLSKKPVYVHSTENTSQWW